jgi:hypothetical protein
MRERGRLVPALAAALALGSGCEVAQVPHEVTIGTSLPLSGVDATTGQAMQRGYASAVESANRAGGVLVTGISRRVRVRLHVRDDGGEASRVEQAAEELASAGCLALLGTAGAVRTAVQAAVAERLARPLVVNDVDAAGLPGAHARWTLSVAVSGDAEDRARQTATVVLDAIAAAAAMEPAALRVALERVLDRSNGLTSPRGLR